MTADDYKMAIVLDTWDTLTMYTSYERTPKRQAWLRSSYEIEGSIDEWLENKFANVIEEYGDQRGLSFEEAAKELRERPVKPWKSSTLRTEAPMMVHAAVMGPKNMTTLGVAQPLTEEGLDSLARHVASKKPGRRYYVVTATTPKHILFKWHVGEGMDHKDGWWVE